MSTIVERHGDNIRNAIKYIDEELNKNSSKSLHRFLSEAGAKFNLSPKDEEELLHFFKSREGFKK